MRTVAETPIFQRYAADIWSPAEREEFVTWIAGNPQAGDLINVLDETIWLPIAYMKGKFDNLPTSFLAELKQGVEDAL